jgi:hypothetical protein
MISPKSGMHPTANQRGCHRELAAHHVALASGDGGVSPEIELISPSKQFLIISPRQIWFFFCRK